MRAASRPCVSGTAGIVRLGRGVPLRRPTAQLAGDVVVWRPRSPRPTSVGSTACRATSASIIVSPTCGRTDRGNSVSASAASRTMSAVDEPHHVERRAGHRLCPRSGRASSVRAPAVGSNALMIRCSRPMSCADCSTEPSGGRRSTNRTPRASRPSNVRFDRPPEISSNVHGGVSASTCSPSHASTAGCRSRKRALREPGETHRRIVARAAGRGIRQSPALSLPPKRACAPASPTATLCPERRDQRCPTKFLWPVLSPTDAPSRPMPKWSARCRR